MTVALAGNPNCGKTALFNALTGSRQRVGNWPGVTVERFEGWYRHGAADVCVVDLPGIYSFSAYSIDESISREYILTGRPAVVVNIVDATNLERNLYLTTQLLEMRVPVVVALNMMDLAQRRGLGIEVEHLTRHLGCPVVPLVASRGKGLGELKRAIQDVAASHAVPAAKVDYGAEVEQALEELSAASASVAGTHGVDARWLAVKLLEGDELGRKLTAGALSGLVDSHARRIEKHAGESIDIVMADGRYGFVHGLASDVIRHDPQRRRTFSDAIDAIVLNRLAGIPIFLGVMYLMFLATINVGRPFIDFLDGLCGTVFVDGFRVLLEHLGCPALAIMLLADGIGGSIQTVATFIPPIFLIFVCLAVLEDSGYMARAAFVMDRLLRTIGLPGKAFLPMLVGFGCNVPAILSTRTLENRRDRIMTVIMNPFVSCGARLPVYTLFVAAFFADGGGGRVVFALYLTGIALAIGTGLLLRRTVLAGEASTFVMELPPYHVPTLRGVLVHAWIRLSGFLVRAGRVIVPAVIVLSLLNAWGADGTFGRRGAAGSVLATVGRSITPALRPMGVTDDNWPATVGLFTGIFAKEAVVGALDALYAQDGSDPRVNASPGEQAGARRAEDFDLRGGLRDAFAAIPAGFSHYADWLRDPIGVGGAAGSPADRSQAAGHIGIHARTFSAIGRYFRTRSAAVAYLLFILIYSPCIAAVAAVYRETNLRWAIFSVTYQTLLAWTVATAFYQGSTFAAHPAGSMAYLGLCAAIIAGIALALKAMSGRLLTA